MKKIQEIPVFKTEREEQEFWDTHDSTGYIDWNTAKKVQFPNLKPSTKTISLRLRLRLQLLISSPKPIFGSLKKVKHPSVGA